MNERALTPSCSRWSRIPTCESCSPAPARRRTSATASPRPCPRACTGASTRHRNDRSPQRARPAPAGGRADPAGLLRALRQQPGERRRRRARRALPRRPRVPPRDHLQRGRRARRARARRLPNARLLQMPDAAHDRGFAMTSSFSAMLLAGALAFRLLDERAPGRLAAAAAAVLPQATALAGTPRRARLRARGLPRQQRAARARGGSGAEAPRADRRARHRRIRLDAGFPPRPENHPERRDAGRRPAVERWLCAGLRPRPPARARARGPRGRAARARRARRMALAGSSRSSSRHERRRRPRDRAPVRPVRPGFRAPAVACARTDARTVPTRPARSTGSCRA